MQVDELKRRDFITLLGGAAAAWPLALRAQQPGKMLTIGFLGATTPALQSEWTAAFVKRLRELGWIEGRTIAIDFQWGEGRPDRYAEVLAEFVRRKVDVIVTHGASAVLQAKRTTSAVPIVFPVESNPVENGIVSSLARPGGNVTGLSLQRSDTAAKRIELLREIAPRVRRLAILFNAGSASTVLEMRMVEDAARGLGLDLVKGELRVAADIAPTLAGFAGRVDALYVAAEPLVFLNRGQISTLALDARLPTI